MKAHLKKRSVACAVAASSFAATSFFATPSSAAVRCRDLFLNRKIVESADLRGVVPAQEVDLTIHLAKYVRLASYPLSSRQFQALLSVARGLSSRPQIHIVLAGVALQERAALMGSWPERSATSSAARTDLETLTLEPIETVEPLGGGFNTTLLVKFKNGRRGIFKPLLVRQDSDLFPQSEFVMPEMAQRNLKPKRKNWRDYVAFTREVDAGDVLAFIFKQSKFIGQPSKISVPTTIEVGLRHDNWAYGIGSLQIFKNGFTTAKQIISEQPERWLSISRSAVWTQFEADTRLLDFIIGNPDRFANPGMQNPDFAQANWGNILVSDRAASVADFVLIDNAWGRPAPIEFDERYLPDLTNLSPGLKSSIHNFDPLAFSAHFQNRMTAEGLADVMTRIALVQARL